MPHSRVGWVKPITEEHFHDFAEIPSGTFQESNLPGYVAQKSISRYTVESVNFSNCPVRPIFRKIALLYRRPTRQIQLYDTFLIFDLNLESTTEIRILW